jgi:hypothetical protein
MYEFSVANDASLFVATRPKGGVERYLCSYAASAFHTQTPTGDFAPLAKDLDPTGKYAKAAKAATRDHVSDADNKVGQPRALSSVHFAQDLPKPDGEAELFSERQPLVSLLSGKPF